MTNKHFLIILTLIVSFGCFTAHSITKKVYERKIQQRDSIYQVQTLRMYDILSKMNSK